MYLEQLLPADSKPRKILLVDDDPDIRSLTRTFLEHEGYIVYTCGDADRAAQIFHRSPGIDLVITDYSMPRRSGIDLAHELSSLQPSLRLLVISGALVSPDQVTEMQTQGWKFLPKPFSLPQLLSEVHNILAETDSSDRSATLIA
jgi:DNA-binding NtrC family response regulator